MKLQGHLLPLQGQAGIISFVLQSLRHEFADSSSGKAQRNVVACWSVGIIFQYLMQMCDKRLISQHGIQTLAGPNIWNYAYIPCIAMHTNRLGFGQLVKYSTAHRSSKRDFTAS